MRIRLAVALLLVAAIVVVIAIVKFPGPRSAPPPGRTPSRVQQAPTASAQQIVIEYLQWLEKKDFRAAYGRLSKASQQAHSYEDFVTLAEKSGIPNYDIAAAREKTEGTTASVTVPLAEDPAEASFAMVREDGAWKIVFIGGVPAFPYAE